MLLDWRPVLLFCALTAILVWPALINGGPILFFDTMAYLNAGSTALEKIVGYDAQIFFRPEDLPQGTLATGTLAEGAVGAAAEADLSPDTANASRSVYYALFLLALVKAGGLWAVPLAQAALFAAALTAFLVAWLPGRPGAAWAVGLVTAGASAAPFFTSYMMPDFLSGLAMLALLRLMLPPPLASRWEGLAWAALLYLALVSHLSHLLVAIGLFACACLAVPLARLRWPRGGAALVASVLVLAVASEMLFSYAVTRAFGQPPLRPPFVAARMIEDGPGMRHLEAVCPPVPEAAALAEPIAYDTPPPFELCRYRHRLPASSLAILWSTDPDHGVYGTADPASRDRMSDEHLAFAAAVAAQYPAAQARAAISRFAEQMAGFSLTEFPYTDTMRSKFDARLAAELKAGVAATAFYRDRFPLGPADALTRTATVLAAAALVVLFAVSFRRRGSGPGGAGPGTGPGTGMDEARAGIRALRAFAVLVVLGLIGNAAVTGILSAPHDRYQARVYWLLLLAAGLMAASLRHEGARHRGPAATATPRRA